jgi:hypothetical protein
MPGDPLHQKESDVIVCHVTTWYYRRMGLLAAMFLGMGLFFFYDGKYGYPKENAVAEKKVWFEETVLKSYDEARAQGDAALQTWLAMARERGWIVKPALDQPRWDDYGAPHDWPSSPKKHSAEEIEQQFYWGGAMLLGAATAGLLVLLNHAKTLVGHHDHLVMPNGRKVYYKDVFRVDKRKWDNKALATVAYREGGTGPESKVVLDDLKYLGTDKVLNRLLAGFKGELIEKIPDEPEAELVAGDGPAKVEEESAPKNAT